MWPSICHPDYCTDCGIFLSLQKFLVNGFLRCSLMSPLAFRLSKPEMWPFIPTYSILFILNNLSLRLEKGQCSPDKSSSPQMPWVALLQVQASSQHGSELFATKFLTLRDRAGGLRSLIIMWPPVCAVNWWISLLWLHTPNNCRKRGTKHRL